MAFKEALHSSGGGGGAREKSRESSTQKVTRVRGTPYMKSLLPFHVATAVAVIPQLR